MYNDVPVSFLIDTGAGVSLLQGNIWDKIRSDDHKLTTVTLQRLVGVDGMPIRVRGSTLIQFSIGGMEFNHEFVVTDHITAEAILCLDFLEANKCVLDLSKQEMTIRNEVLELEPSPANAIVQQQCATVTVMNTIVVPPSSEMEVMAHVNTQGNGTWLLESIKCPVLIARALATPKLGTIPVRIINTEQIPVTLYKNMKLATAEPINDASISEATNGHSSQQSPREENHITLSHPLPETITMEQKEKLLALMSHYTDIMADSPNKLEFYNIELTPVVLCPFDSKPEECLFLVERLYTTCYKICCPGM